MKTNLEEFKLNNPLASKRPVIVLIPGGPGLSSKSLMGFEVLARSFDLVFVNPPGTRGLPEPENPTFDTVLESIESELSQLNRKMILLGHSFGGFQAAKLVERARLDIVGFIGCATPLSEGTFNEISRQYGKFRTPELAEAEAAWTKNKTKQTMKEWFSSYGLLFFTKNSMRAGWHLLNGDEVSLETFLKIRSDISGHKQLLHKLSETPIKKVMIAGEMDNLVPSKSIRADAFAAKMEFFEIKNVGHFMNLDQPEAVAELIEIEFIDSRKETKP